MGIALRHSLELVRERERDRSDTQARLRDRTDEYITQLYNPVAGIAGNLGQLLNAVATIESAHDISAADQDAVAAFLRDALANAFYQVCRYATIVDALNSETNALSTSANPPDIVFGSRAEEDLIQDLLPRSFGLGLATLRDSSIARSSVLNADGTWKDFLDFSRRRSTDADLARLAESVEGALRLVAGDAASAFLALAHVLQVAIRNRYADWYGGEKRDFDSVYLDRVVRMSSTGRLNLGVGYEGTRNHILR